MGNKTKPSTLIELDSPRRTIISVPLSGLTIGSFGALAPLAGYILLAAGVGVSCLVALNRFSYHTLKRRILQRQRWDLNICCGKTDGGGVNADIVSHSVLPNFVRVESVYSLPFDRGRFENVLSSHTVEHVESPERFYRELRRVGRNVTLVIPPLWDISAALNILEHKYIFLSWRKEHRQLPPSIKFPLAETVHKLLGQRIRA